MAKLNQIVAVEKGVKAKAERDLTDAYHALQKEGTLSGIARVYVPRKEDGDQLPPESTRVQYTAETAVADAAVALTRLFDVEATKDVANTQAKADVVVDGVTLVEDAPPTLLLFLEKKLADVRAFVGKLPTLDPAYEWVQDAAPGVWRTVPIKTAKTTKIPQNHVLAEATKEHPAQVQVFTIDEVVGDWTTTKFSGAIREDRRSELLDRVDRLLAAVKFAREEANGHAVTDVKIGEAVFDYLFES